MKALKKNEQTIIILTLIFINFLIKGIFLSSNSLAGDEPFSVYHAQMDIDSIIRLLSAGNNPPLYEILLHFWIKLFGISEFSVRFPSLIFSSITVLYIYKLGTKFLNKRIALYSSIIFILSNYHILFAHEARVYSLLGLLSVISMYYFMNIIQYCNLDTKADNNLKSTVRNNLIILILVNTFIIYSHYFGFFILITQFIFIIFNKKIFLKYWKQILIYSSIIGLLYLPNIFVFLNRFIESSLNGTWVKPPSGVESIYNMIWQFSNAPVVAVFCILVLVISLVKSTINKKQKNIYESLVVFWFVFIFFFMYSTSYLVPIFMDRYVMPAAISYGLLIGISVDYLIEKPKYRFIIPALICILFMVTVKPNITNKRNVKETVKKIRDLKANDVIVYICPSWFEMNFIYYYDNDCFKDYNTEDIKRNMFEYLNSDNIFPINSWQEIDAEQISHFDKVIFLDAGADFSFPNNNIKNQLGLNYNLINKFKFYEIFHVFEYKSK